MSKEINDHFCSKCQRLLKSANQACPQCHSAEFLSCPKCGSDVQEDDLCCKYCGVDLFRNSQEREKQQLLKATDEVDEELVCVRTFLNAYETELARGLLESFGIWSLAKNDDAGGMYPSMPLALPSQLFVRQADLEKAKAILENRALPTP